MLARLSLCLVLFAAAPSHALSLLSEGFDDISLLPAAGWVQLNNGAPVGTTGWFQGNGGVVAAHGGATDSYVAANFENAALGGNVSNWLLTPALTLNNGDEISFFTRSTGALPDRLEVRLSTNAASTNVGASDASVGDFTTLLLVVNPALDSSYPSDWTEFTVSLAGLSGPTLGRIAFRGFVPDTFVNGDYIGIDTLTISSAPEPKMSTLLAIGTLALSALKRRALREATWI